MEVRVGKYLLDTEPETVRQWMANHETQNSCDCAYCRNFEATAKTFPAEIQAFFEPLGLDLLKPREVAENGKDEDGRRWYTAWYHLPGKILENGEEIALTEECFCHFQNYCYRLPEGFPRPSFQLNMDICLPWVLEESEA